MVTVSEDVNPIISVEASEDFVTIGDKKYSYILSDESTTFKVNVTNGTLVENVCSKLGFESGCSYSEGIITLSNLNAGEYEITFGSGSATNDFGGSSSETPTDLVIVVYASDSNFSVNSDLEVKVSTNRNDFETVVNREQIDGKWYITNGEYYRVKGTVNRDIKACYIVGNT